MMRQQPSSPSTKRKIFVWILIGTLFICLSFFTYFLIVYQEAMESKEETFATSKQKAIQETPIVEVSDIERFNGEQAYDIVTGYTENQEKGYAYIPIQEGEEVTFKLESEGLTKDEMLAKWREECSHCELEKITPGIAKNNYIWEIIYKDRDKLVFSYYLFTTGSLFEQLR